MNLTWKPQLTALSPREHRMNTDFSALPGFHLLGESATHPLARLLTRLPLHPQGAGRIRKAACAATTPLSRLLAGSGLRRTREGQAESVKPLKRQQPRSRCFAAGTRSDAANYGFQV